MMFQGLLLATAIAVQPASYVTTSDGTRIHYVEKRSPQPVSDTTFVFLPGWMMPGAIWKHQLDGLSANYRVIAIDPRSQGDSTKASDGNYPAKRADDLRQVIVQRELHHVVLVAATSGVVDAVSYIKEFGTDRLDGLVLVHGVAGADYDVATVMNLMKWAQRFQTDRAEQTESFVRSLFVQQPPPAADVQWLTVEALKMPTSAAIAAFVGSLTADLRSSLPKIDKQTLIIVGESRWHEQYETLTRAIPGARLMKIEGTAHAPYFEKPSAFNDALTEFARSLSADKP